MEQVWFRYPGNLASTVTVSNEHSDQDACMHKLVWVFALGKNNNIGFSVTGQILILRQEILSIIKL